jgi:hypothetical protein
VDPTSVVAPDRIDLGLNSFLERSAASGQIENRRSALMRNLARWPIFTEVRLAWQTLNYTWDTRVLSFDGDAQESFFASIGIGDRGPISLVVGTVVIATGLLAFYAGWTRLRTRPGGNRVRALYENFCRKAARLGAQRDPSEGPLDFSHRATRLLPNESERIRIISTAYIALRYASAADPSTLDQFAKEVNAFGSAS